MSDRSSTDRTPVTARRHHHTAAQRQGEHAAPRRSHRRHTSRRGSGRTAPSHFSPTSVSTSRGAYAETRVFLLQTYGPICAYCGERHVAETLTLDHVTPRKGQTAYDRRDNLVLACKTCNGKKRDLPVLGFLFADRRRAIHLYQNGQHLSAGLLDLVTSLIPVDRLGDVERSPYRD